MCGQVPSSIVYDYVAETTAGTGTGANTFSSKVVGLSCLLLLCTLKAQK